MRLLGLDAKCWGPLRDRHFALSERIFLVYGRNEAGKSSFRSALETLLYGFSPAQRDSHPLATWSSDGANLHIEAELVLDDETTIAVERTMQSRGTLRIARGGEEFQGRKSASKNAPLPQLAAIPRDLFRAVYCLTTSDVIELDGDVRRHVDELLLGEKTIEGLRPTYLVREELIEDAGALWRSTDIGKPRSKEVRAELREARRALRRARTNEEELRGVLEEYAELEDELDELKVRRRALAREAEEARFLGALAELERRTAPVPELAVATLEKDPLVDPVELETMVHRLDQRLAEPRARLEREALTLPASARRILACGPAIESAAGELARHELEEEAEADTRAGADELFDEVQGALVRVCGCPPEEVDEETLGAFPLDGLRAAGEAWQEALDDDRTRSTRPPLWLVVAAAVGAGVALASLDGLLSPFVGALGLAMLATALFVAVARSRVEDAAPEARKDVLRLIQRLSIDPSAASTPASLGRLIERLEDQRTKLENAYRANGRALDLARRIAERTERAEELAGRAGIEGLGGAPASEILTRLDAALDDAREAAAADLADRADRERAQADLATHGPELERLAKRLERVIAALGESFPHLAADPGAAFRAWREAEKEAEFVLRRRAELEADPLYARLADDPRLDAGLTEPPWHPSSMRARDDELGEIENRMEGVQRRLGEIQRQLDDDEGSSVARAHELVRELEAQYESVCIQRDRLALMERVLAEADRLHREEHQPDVLRRASRYLESITTGRYTRLDYPEGDVAGLHVFSAERNEAIPVGEPLSRGTRDQIYMCLRLGLLDHLDVGRESLPLILDETLVHWDRGRRAELYPVLEEVAERRQVILFTCHESFAEESESAMELVRIDLSEVPSGAAVKAHRTTRKKRASKSDGPNLFS
ncbi:MAG: AAA family ATPase [bacterium]|nr:AAA family ATPase [bacterium]